MRWVTELLEYAEGWFARGSPEERLLAAADAYARARGYLLRPHDLGEQLTGEAHRIAFGFSVVSVNAVLRCQSLIPTRLTLSIAPRGSDLSGTPLLTGDRRFDARFAMTASNDERALGLLDRDLRAALVESQCDAFSYQDGSIAMRWNKFKPQMFRRFDAAIHVMARAARWRWQ